MEPRRPSLDSMTPILLFNSNPKANGAQEAQAGFPEPDFTCNHILEQRIYKRTHAQASNQPTKNQEQKHVKVDHRTGP